MAQTNTNLDQNKFAAAEELPKAQSKVKEFTKKVYEAKNSSCFSCFYSVYCFNGNYCTVCCSLRTGSAGLHSPSSGTKLCLISGVQMSLARMYSAV